MKSFSPAILLAGVALVGCGFGDGTETGGAGNPGTAGTSTAGVGAAGVGAAGVGAAGTTGVAGGGAGSGAAGMGAAGTTINPMPTLLSQTGLFADITKDSQTVMGQGIYSFEPTYKLWSDSATKRRWVYMPPGQKIDTSVMAYWNYPVGFKLFKEFTRDGVRVETRMIMKRAPGDWYLVAFKWNADGKDAVAVPKGEQNASGTMHDIPSQENCTTCHGPNTVADTALGFSALQLSHDVTDASLNLQKIKAMGWLTDPPTVDKFVLPGTPVESAALGYLHANCGNCHNDYGKVYQTSADLDLWVHVEKPDQLTSVQKMFGYLSMVCDQWPGPNGKADRFAPIESCAAGHATGAKIEGSISMMAKRITPKLPAMSAIHEVMSERGTQFSMSQMPPIGSEIIDPTGIAGLDAWIMALPAN